MTPAAATNSTPQTRGSSSTTTRERPIPPKSRSRSFQGGDPDDAREAFEELHEDWASRIGWGDDWCE
jgi:hypothetical protein